ncbi:ABC transporter permease [Coralloluteibacterium stylophorae]|uniref:ABC transporter permease n=1 Tax=Coralloluteibacterium stylophorae TaxID=1776034 RepID=A0A8J7VTV9_9GAMM|nr:ABC transporter permease [Coralloluteibacterium stylophorae]MBS7458836.1 ABC transporter permease [Coralloluteibacterium stylophorae]
MNPALFVLAWRSLRNRAFIAGLTVATVGLAVALLLGVQRLQTETRQAFLRSVSGTDLIVGARSHPVQLLLYSVFHLGDATNNLGWDAYVDLADDPAVAWAVPVSLGDSHRGFRVVGTTVDYFRRLGFAGRQGLAFAQGEAFSADPRESVAQAVVGADVAERLGYAPGSEIVLAHGTARVALNQHDDHPFRVVGVLARTGTAADGGVYVSLAAIEAIHLNWRSGTRIGTAPDAATLPDAALQPRAVTAVFVGLKSRLATFALQRTLNEYPDEPLTAILPGVALQQLWSMLGTVERAMEAAGAAVLAAALMVLLTTVLATLNERRREMAILRAVGAGPWHVFGLLLMEAALLALAGGALGLAIVEVGLRLAAPWLQARYGLHLGTSGDLGAGLQLLGWMVLAGLLLGLLPATLAYRRSVQDGMTVTQ